MQPLYISGQEHAHAGLDKSILRALLYFDIFQYPLTAQEVILYMDTKVEHLRDVELRLQWLADNLFIYRFGDVYSVHNNVQLAERRKLGNVMAAKVLSKASRRARLIQKFPFVRSVNISGSLSKNYFDAFSDVDYFVITSPERVWFCRLLLTIFKKVFLLNRRKFFCINYYIDTNALTIPDANKFAATEIITLQNQTGGAVFKQFIAANQWAQEYFPNADLAQQVYSDTQTGNVKRLIEQVFNGKLGNRLDDFAFYITTRFLRTKYAYLKQEEFEVSFRARKNASKHHPNGFQFRVMEAYEQQCANYKAKHGIELL